MDLAKVSNLSRNYGKKIALDSVSFSIKESEVFGLLGPNGAGKTTIISVLTTLLYPTSGTIKVDNYDIVKDSKEIRKLIGVIFQDFLLDDDLTAFQNLDIHSRLYGFDKETRLKTIKNLLKLVDLEKEQKNKVSTFSGGMKRRLEIARGLISNPKILFLDEPTLGLDPIAKRNIWQYIKNLKKKTTIIIATNNMEEAEKLCDRIAIINKGKIVRIGSVKQIKGLLKKKSSLEDVFIHLTK